MFCFAFCKKMLGFSFKQKESNEQTKILQKAEKKQNKKIGNPNNGGQKKQMAKGKGSNNKNRENNKMGTSKGKRNKMGTPSAENYQHDSNTTPTNNDSTEQTKIADTNSSNQTSSFSSTEQTKIADTNSSNQTSSFSSTENENIFKKLIEINKDLDEKGKIFDDISGEVSKILTELESIKKYVSVLDENKDNSLIKKFKNLIPSFGNSSSNSNSNSSSGITKEFSTKLTTLENSLHTLINSSRNQTDDIKKLMTISEELRNSNKSLTNKINAPVQNQTPVDILKKADKADIEFIIAKSEKDLNKKIDSLKDENISNNIDEIKENVETSSGKLQNIQNSIDELSKKVTSSQNLQNSQIQNELQVPKEKIAIDELEKYMKTGLEELSNISRLYIEKEAELKNIDNLKKSHEAELEKTRNDFLEKGKKEARVEIANNLANKHPSVFKDKLMAEFSDIVSEDSSLKVDEVIEITNENKNSLTAKIEGELVTDSKYKIIKSAIYIDGKLIFRAIVEKIEIDKTSQKDEN